MLLSTYVKFIDLRNCEEKSNGDIFEWNNTLYLNWLNFKNTIWKYCWAEVRNNEPPLGFKLVLSSKLSEVGDGSMFSWNRRQHGSLQMFNSKTPKQADVSLTFSRALNSFAETGPCRPAFDSWFLQCALTEMRWIMGLERTDLEFDGYPRFRLDGDCV